MNWWPGGDDCMRWSRGTRLGGKSSHRKRWWTSAWRIHASSVRFWNANEQNKATVLYTFWCTRSKLDLSISCNPCLWEASRWGFSGTVYVSKAWWWHLLSQHGTGAHDGERIRPETDTGGGWGDIKNESPPNEESLGGGQRFKSWLDTQYPSLRV